METVKEKIILAAANLFTQNGLKSVTMDDVASSIAISKRTIYQNFKDKYDLVSYVVDFFIEQQDAKEKLIEENTPNIIEELFEMFNILNDNFEQKGRVSIEIKKYYPDIFQKKYIQHYQTGYEKLCKKITRGVKQGIILPNINTKFAAYVIMASVNNIMASQEKLFYKSSISIPEAFKYVIIHFFRGISTQKGIDLIDNKINSQK